MQLTRFIPIAVAALLVLPSVDRVRAAEPMPTRERMASASASSDELTAEQLEETMDYLCSQAASTVVSLVMTMSYAPGQWKVYNGPVADTFLSTVIKPGPAPSDSVDPSGNGPGPTPQELPEPGTLVAGLAGASAFLYRYLRRRTKPEAMDTNDEVELAR